MELFFVLHCRYKINCMQHIRTEDLVVIDIETASESSSFSDLHKDWQKLWEEKTAKSLPDEITAAEFYPMRAGVMAEFSKIVCISMGYFVREQNLKMRIKSFSGDDEAKILSNFLETMTKIEGINNKWCFAGHNIKEFDIPFICRRLLVNHIAIPKYLDFQNMKPWETNIVDTFQYWRFGDYKNYTSLNLLAATMKVPSSKDDIDGSMVGDLYHKGNEQERKESMQRIVTYCQKDVVTTANIILRFKNIPLLHEDDIVITG
jgi:3'-5' exonuclease